MADLLRPSLKFVGVVLAMICLYPVCLMLICEFWILVRGRPFEGSLAGWFLTYALHLLSILVVSLLAGIVFPKDRWIVGPAAILAVLYYCVCEVVMWVHFSNAIPGLLVASDFVNAAVSFVAIASLGYWLSRRVHRAASTLPIRKQQGGQACSA